MRWLRRAADQGDAPAQANVGVMYNFGQGVRQDYVAAHMWMNLAASRASGDEQKTFSQWRDEVASKMTSQQVAERTACPRVETEHLPK